LRRRRGQDTWFYAAEFGDGSLEIKGYDLVPPEDAGLQEHSHGDSYDAYLGETLSVASMGHGLAHARYDFTETEDRTDTYLLDMVEHPQEWWFGGLVKVVTIPDEVDWYVFEDEDGSESVHERHRTWF